MGLILGKIRMEFALNHTRLLRVLTIKTLRIPVVTPVHPAPVNAVSFPLSSVILLPSSAYICHIYSKHIL